MHMKVNPIIQKLDLSCKTLTKLQRLINRYLIEQCDTLTT